MLCKDRNWHFDNGAVVIGDIPIGNNAAHSILGKWLPQIYLIFAYNQLQAIHSITCYITYTLSLRVMYNLGNPLSTAIYTATAIDSG